MVRATRPGGVGDENGEGKLTVSERGGPSPFDVLHDVFGFTEFRPGQLEVIDAVLGGNDCIALLPTGYGKSLTFQIPAKVLPGTVLVISPLISLMKDQVDALRRVGFSATAINSALDRDERDRRIHEARAGRYELVYLAPEALTGWMRREVSGWPLSLIVVDEAHCISQWGHDFRTSYRRLHGLKEELGGIPVLALTATATRPVARDVIRQLGMRKPSGYRGSFFRSNLRVYCRKKGEGNTREEILGLIRAREGAQGIVYCLSRRTVEQTTAFLEANGIRAVSYHAGLADWDRAEAQDDFARDNVQVIVATIAFGMGIDKSNVRFVIHRDMPKDIESWYQEMGRAGRDGLPSDCFLFYSWADVKLHERFLDSIEDPDLWRAKAEATRFLYRTVESHGCRHQQILAHFGEAIDPCGASCDVCTDVTAVELAAEGMAGHPAPRGTGRRSSRGRRSGSGQQGEPLSVSDLTDQGQALFERLRALRKTLADKENVPAYIIFNDRTLLAMAAERPTDAAGLLDVHGIGPAKLERYGEDVLAVLQAGAAPREELPGSPA